MESESYSTDSEEDAQILQEEVFRAQKLIQESGAVDEEVLIQKLNRESNPEIEADEEGEDPAPTGSLEEKILKASESGKLEVVEQLLQKNAKLVAAHDRDGYTPLHRSCYSNHVDIAELLLKNGADMNARTCDGWTPLHSACKWNNYNCAALLLDFGSEVNPLTNGGQTPLHLASSHPEAKETLHLLLTNPKIALNIRNKAGELASEIAHRHCKYYKLFEINDPCFNNI